VNTETRTDTAEPRPSTATAVLGPLLVTLGLAALLVVAVAAVPWRDGLFILAGTALVIAGTAVMARRRP
jgi:hypothetical protein